MQVWPSVSSRARLLKAIRAFNAALNQYTGGWQPQLALELAFIEILQEAPAPAAAIPAPAQSPAPPMSQGPAHDQRPRHIFSAPMPAPPGEPAAFSANTIQAGWEDILSQAFRYDPGIPPLFVHVQSWHIEGQQADPGRQQQSLPAENV